MEDKPVERKEYPCPKCSAPLHRYKKKAGGIGWFCTNEECKTFMDDDKGVTAYTEMTLKIARE